MSTGTPRAIVVVASNKKADYQYSMVTKYKAGIQLVGTEVKSIRAGRISLSDAYCVFIHGELWVRNIHIAEYQQGGISNHQPKRARKLLLNKRELRKLESRIKERGLTIIPTEVFFNERNLVKIEIGLAKGRKTFDKSHRIKEKDMKRDMARSLRDKY